MEENNPKRFDRIVAILIQLQSKRIIKAQELADRFQVSLRTIYRDIKTLEASGVPISSEAGIGYSIMEGYRLPPVMFTKEEASSFVAAEKLMQHFTDKSLGEYFQSAMYKVKSVLRWTEKDWVDTLAAQILIQPTHLMFNTSVPNALEILMDGIVNKKQVKIIYQSIEAESPAERVVEPIGLYHEHAYWYMFAYCHLREDYRKFRTDRIYKIETTRYDFENEHESLAYYLSEKESDEDKIPVKISVDKKISRHLQRTKKYYGFVSEREIGENIEMDYMLRKEEEEYFARWYMMYGDQANILEPQSLKDKVRALTERVGERVGLDYSLV